jgi:fatty-acyl-CoA synthase
MRLSATDAGTDSEESIPAGIARAPSGAGLTIMDEQLDAVRLSYGDLAVSSVDAARRLRAAGIHQGDRVCILAPTSPAMVVNLMGLWRLGAVPVVLPRSRRADAAWQQKEVARRVDSAGAAAMLVTDETAGRLGGRMPVAIRTIEQVAACRPNGPIPAMPGPSDLALLQFTSGTTADSRAVPIQHGQIVGNMRRILEVTGHRPDDVFVSWLPLYHDMGINSLGGFTASGMEFVIMATEAFMQAPSVWMRGMMRHRGTMTAAPSFAYGLAARTQELRPAALDLSTVRVAFNGAEAVNPDIVERAASVFAPAGMSATAMCPTYGLAEATLAVTSTSPEDTFLIRDAAVSSSDSSAAGPRRRLVSCGRAIADTFVAIRDEARADMPDGTVGQIWVKGPGVIDAYWGEPPGPAATADGWLPTGDLGLVEDGELFVCGRIKDMIIIGGRNIYPEDYEEIAEQVPGIRSGNVIAFSLPEIERMVLVAEGRGTRARTADLGRSVLERFHATIGHAPHEVIIVRPGTLPKTSSGKRQRGLCREQYLSGDLEVVHTAAR